MLRQAYAAGLAIVKLDPPVVRRPTLRRGGFSNALGFGHSDPGFTLRT